MMIWRKRENWSNLLDLDLVYTKLKTVCCYKQKCFNDHRVVIYASNEFEIHDCDQCVLTGNDFYEIKNWIDGRQ